MMVNLGAVAPRLRQQLLFRSARQVARQLKKASGALAVGIGRRQRNSKIEQEWCVKVYVRRKLKRPTRQKALPREMHLTVTVNQKRYRLSVPLDVVEVGRVVPHSFIRNSATPTEIGSPCAELTSNVGTKRLLAAGHVVARNLITTATKKGELIINDSGAPIGKLDAFSNMTSTPLDAGLVECNGPISPLLPRYEAASVSRMRSSNDVFRRPYTRYSMQSWTGPIEASFVGIVYDYPVNGTYAVGLVVFRQLLHFEAACRRGDSGSLVTDSDGFAVGMHILGTDVDDVPPPRELVSLCVPLESICEKIAPPQTWRITA